MEYDRSTHITGAEFSILKMLVDNGAKPMYGLELVERSDGKLKRGSVYVLLDRLDSKGFVVGKKEDSSTVAVPRKLYRITATGRKVFQTWEPIASMGGLRGAFA